MCGARIGVFGATVLGATTLHGPTDSFEGIDMIVFIANDGEPIDRDGTLLAAQRARMRGMLVAGVLVTDRDDDRSAVLDVLREAADSLIVVRERASVEAIVASLG